MGIGNYLLFLINGHIVFVFIVFIIANTEARIKALETEKEELKVQNEYV